MTCSNIFLVPTIACVLLLAGRDAAPITKTVDPAQKSRAAVVENKIAPVETHLDNKVSRPNSDAAKIVKMLDEVKSRVIPSVAAEKSAKLEGTAPPARLQLVPGGSGLPGDKGGKAMLQRLDSIKQAAEQTDAANSNQESVEFDLSQALDPQAVAEYLLVTGDFSSFDETIEDLLKANLLDPNDVPEYADLVKKEYEALLAALLAQEEEEEPEVEEEEQAASIPDLDTLYELVSRLPAEEQENMLAIVNEYAQQEANLDSPESTENELDQSEPDFDESNEEDELKQLKDTESKETNHNSDIGKNSVQQSTKVAQEKHVDAKEKKEESKKSTH